MKIDGIVRLYLVFTYVNVHSSFALAQTGVEFDSSVCPTNQVDPTDMGSYSYSSKCNQISDNGGVRQDREIDEIIVKKAKAIYHSTNRGRSKILPKELKNGDGLSFPSSLTQESDTDEQPYVEFTEETTKFSRTNCTCPTIDETPLMTYIRRIVGSLLEQMGVHNHHFGPDETITIDLQGEMSYKSYMDLTLFLSSKPKSGEASKQLQTVSEIMSNLLHIVPMSHPVDSLSLYERLEFHLPMLTTPKFWLILLSLTVMIFIIVTLFCLIVRSRDSLKLLVVYTAVLFYVFSIIWIYVDELENAKAENSARLRQFETTPSDCQYDNLPVLDKLKYFFRVQVAGYDDRCLQYYRETTSDPFYRYTPVEAISQATARFIFTPFGFIGSKLGSFIAEFTAAVPVWLRPILPLMIFVSVFFYLCPYRIRTLLFTIEPAYRDRPERRAQIMEPLPQPHRARVLDVVPLDRADASTDTDDLEDYVRRQGQGHAPRLGFPVTPSRAAIWWAWVIEKSLSVLYWILEVCQIFLRVACTFLRDVPIVPESQVRALSDNEEIHLNLNEVMLAEAEVPVSERDMEQIPSAAKVMQVSANPVSFPDSPANEDKESTISQSSLDTSSSMEFNSSPSTSRDSRRGTVDGNLTCTIDEGFPVDFDELTLAQDDDLLEGEIVHISGEGRKLNFSGIFTPPGQEPST